MHADFERTLQLSVDLKIWKFYLSFFFMSKYIIILFFLLFQRLQSHKSFVCWWLFFFVSLSQHTIFFGEFLSPKVCVVFLFDDLRILFFGCRQSLVNVKFVINFEKCLYDLIWNGTLLPGFTSWIFFHQFSCSCQKKITVILLFRGLQSCFFFHGCSRVDSFERFVDNQILSLISFSPSKIDQVIWCCFMRYCKISVWVWILCWILLSENNTLFLIGIFLIS